MGYLGHVPKPIAYRTLHWMVERPVLPQSPISMQCRPLRPPTCADSNRYYTAVFSRIRSLVVSLLCTPNKWTSSPSSLQTSFSPSINRNGWLPSKLTLTAEAPTHIVRGQKLRTVGEVWKRGWWSSRRIDRKNSQMYMNWIPIPTYERTYPQSVMGHWRRISFSICSGAYAAQPQNLVGVGVQYRLVLPDEYKSSTTTNWTL